METVFSNIIDGAVQLCGGEVTGSRYGCVPGILEKTRDGIRTGWGATVVGGPPAYRSYSIHILFIFATKFYKSQHFADLKTFPTNLLTLNALNA